VKTAQYFILISLLLTAFVSSSECRQLVRDDRQQIKHLLASLCAIDSNRQLLEEPKDYLYFVEALAKHQESVIDPVIEAVRSDELSSGAAYDVLLRLSSAASRKRMIQILYHDRNETIFTNIAKVLAEWNDKNAADAIKTALFRVQYSQFKASLTEDLWKIKPDIDSAKAILRIARKSDRSSFLELISKISEEPRKELLTDREMALYFLSTKFPRSIDAALVSLTTEKGIKELFSIDPEMKEFVESHRDVFVSVAMEIIQENPSTSGCPEALLLGYFQEEQALPYLRKRFLSDPFFYGWEASCPDPIGENQFPNHHCYEEAIKAITKRPVEEAITLSPTEVSELVMGSQNNEMYSAMYVLSRLEPEIFKKELFYRFRKFQRAPDWCNVIVAFIHSLKSIDELKKELGQPENFHKDLWLYACEKGWVGADAEEFPLYLAVQVQGNRIIDAYTMIQDNSEEGVPFSVYCRE
jgi:hypothetical protein